MGVLCLVYVSFAVSASAGLGGSLVLVPTLVVFLGSKEGIALAALLLPAGHAGPAFLVQANFRAILDYNNSTKYALAVGHLADRIAGGGPFRGTWPVDEPAFTRTESLELQQLLADLGYETGPIDGIVGPLTRTAVRGFQRDVGRPADGFPTQILMDQLRRTHAVLRRQAKPAAAG